MTKTLKRPAALVHLKAEGWEVAKTKFYEDIKKGFPSLQDDKTLLLTDLNAYARAYLKRKTGADAGHAMAEDQSEKTREEILKIRAQRENTQFDLAVKQKKYLPRADFSREMASRAVVLDTTLHHHFRSHAARWIALVGGDPRKLADLTAALDEGINEGLNRFATMDHFQVMVIDGDGDE